MNGPKGRDAACFDSPTVPPGGGKRKEFLAGERGEGAGLRERRRVS